MKLHRGKNSKGWDQGKMGRSFVTTGRIATLHYVCMYGDHILHSMDQPGKVANPARGQLNRENGIPLSSYG